MEYSRRQRLCSLDDSAVSRFDFVSRYSSRSSQTNFSRPRSRRNFSVDCRNLHALHFRSDARADRLDIVWIDLVAGSFRIDDESDLWRASSLADRAAVSLDGLAGRHRGAASSVSNATARIALAARGRL